MPTREGKGNPIGGTSQRDQVFPPHQEAKCNLRVVEDVSRLIENATRKRDEQHKNQIVPVPASSNKKSRRIKSSLQ